MKKALSRSPWLYVAVFFVVGLIMTLYEVVKEAVFQHTLAPWESHIITILVTSFLATFAAVSIRSWSERILKKEQEARLQQKKMVTLELILQAVHHIVNNFLNHFILIKHEAEDRGVVGETTLALLDSSIEEVKQQLKVLEGIADPEKEESYREIYPQ